MNDHLRKQDLENLEKVLIAEIIPVKRGLAILNRNMEKQNGRILKLEFTTTDLVHKDKNKDLYCPYVTRITEIETNQQKDEIIKEYVQMKVEKKGRETKLRFAYIAAAVSIISLLLKFFL